MSYYKTYKKKFYKKKYYKKSYGKRPTYKATYRIANKAVLSKAEKKWIEYNGTAIPVDNANPALTFISSVPSGGGANQRSGNKITPTSLRFQLTVTPDTTLVDNVYRLLLVQWLAPEATAPMAVSDVLNNTTAVLSVFSAYKQTAKFRFKVLYDQKRSVSPQTGRSVARFSVLIPMKRMKSIFFDGANLGQNTIYFILLDQNGTPVAQSRYDWYSMFRYIDV